MFMNYRLSHGYSPGYDMLHRISLSEKIFIHIYIIGCNTLETVGAIICWEFWEKTKKQYYYPASNMINIFIEYTNYSLGSLRRY